MRTIFTVNRLKEPTPSYTVLLRTAGNGAVDVNLWLNDAEATELALQLALAATPTVTEPAAEAA